MNGVVNRLAQEDEQNESKFEIHGNQHWSYGHCEMFGGSQFRSYRHETKPLHGENKRNAESRSERLRFLNHFKQCAIHPKSDVFVLDSCICKNLDSCLHHRTTTPRLLLGCSRSIHSSVEKISADKLSKTEGRDILNITLFDFKKFL